ncbi:MAG: hypothetical protein ABS84_14125 [Rubrivivax sp. SCN 71-131]|jgi:hypothetical protein|nr:MAG: hypothetical protein ABS84_14125 [Rubrivivax sp. SCN 71-131]
MAQQSQVRNPFMLMLQPEVVLAAIRKSERLERLNRHLCRPLDQQHLSFAASEAAITALSEADEPDELDS